MLPFVLLFGLALAIRLYHLAYNPLWLDEIYNYQLGQQGLGAILRNSLYDPHPPLYYLLQWITAGGSSHSELAWRWLPVISGAMTIPLVYEIIRKVYGALSAGLSSLLLAVSPAHLYFSQEARPFAFEVFLAALTTFWIVEIQDQPQKRGLWLGVITTTLIGLYSSYSYILVVGIQAVYLTLQNRRERWTYVYLSFIGAASISLLPFATRTIGKTASAHMDNISLNLLATSQALLAGEPLRYGITWAHTWAPLLLGGLFLLGASTSFRHPQQRSLSVYATLQLTLPLFAFFAIINPIFGIHLPPGEAKQFIVLLPAFFILVASGIHNLWKLPTPFPKFIASVAVSVVTIASMSGMKNYWQVTKSSESETVLAVRKHLQPGDAIISLHYSLNAAASFYLPDQEVFARPTQTPAGYDFSHSLSILPVPLRSPEGSRIPLATIREKPRIWLLSHENANPEIIRAISQGCTVTGQWKHPPFKTSLLTDCSP